MFETDLPALTYTLLVFALCCFIVYTIIGVLGAILVAIIGSGEEHGLRESILDGMENIKLPFPMIAMLFFGCLIWGWPWILRMIRKETEKENAEKDEA